MLELTIKSNYINDPGTKIVINGEIQKNVSGKEITFRITQAQECEIIFMHSETPPPHKYWIMYFLFLPLSLVRMLIGMFSLETYEKWYNSINPYSFSAKGKLYINDNKTIRIGYSEASYNETEKRWSKPKFNCSCAEIKEWEINTEINKIAFYNQYFDYFCVMSMMGITCIVLFGLPSWKYFSAGRMDIFMITGSVLILLLSIIAFKLICEYRHMRELLFNCR